MSENIQSISQGTYTIGQTSSSDSSLLVNENSGNVSILQGTVSTSAGIVGDGTTQNPLRADETVLWSGDAIPNNLTPIAQLTEPISAFDSYEVYCSFEDMYPPKASKFKTPTTWKTQPRTNVYFGGIAEAVSWKPNENNNIMHAYMALGFGTNLTDFYCISGSNLDLGKAANATATRSNYAAGLYHIYKVVGINRIANN